MLPDSSAVIYLSKNENRDATIGASDSGYMNDKLGLLSISQHLEPHTYTDHTRILIIDGHSLQVCWSVVQYGQDHTIHIIQLLLKPTQILVPLDVGCFGYLQTSYD